MRYWSLAYSRVLICYRRYCVQGRPPDWQDFVGIITLLFINSTISFMEENNAGNAAAALMARLAPKAKVCRVLGNHIHSTIENSSPSSKSSCEQSDYRGSSLLTGVWRLRGMWKGGTDNFKFRNFSTYERSDYKGLGRRGIHAVVSYVFHLVLPTRLTFIVISAGIARQPMGWTGCQHFGARWYHQHKAWWHCSSGCTASWRRCSEDRSSMSCKSNYVSSDIW